MATDRPAARGSDDDSFSDSDFETFLTLLNRLKATGCTLLVVGTGPRELFTRASRQLLGDADVERHRILAITDATSQSIAERLPDSNVTPRPLTETTTILNHAGPPRSVTAVSSPDTLPELIGIRERCIADPELQGLETELIDAIRESATRADDLQQACLRVGVDSLDPLIDHYGEDSVKRCLDAVSGHVREHCAMAHYVLRAEYDSECVQTLVPSVDAIIELRSVDPEAYGHDAQQRWLVPDEGIETKWIRL